MRTATLIIITLILLVLQVVAVDKLSIGDISPDLVLLICAFLALYRGPVRGAVIGFVIGFLQDLFNPALLGVNAMTKSLVGFSFGHLGAKAVPEQAVFLAVVFFLGALGHDFVYLLFFTALDVKKFVILLSSVALPSALYTAAFGVVTHKVLLFLSSWMVRSFGKAR
jgi:rod shape-determining protein MreD